MSQDNQAIPETPALEQATEQRATESIHESSSDTEREADANPNAAPNSMTDHSIHALLEEARSRADEYWNEVLRLRAEIENLRKRTERDIDNVRKYALEKFVESLLNVADSLDLGLKACQEATEIGPLQQGTEMMYTQFFQTLERFGVKPIDPLGEPFNPDLHQAIAVQPSEGESNRVIQVLQKGYQLNERLLRPALVIVSQ